MDNRTRALMQGAAGSGERLYVEDVFSTYLYTGNASTQTITNGIDLSGKGGLVWVKARSIALNSNLVDSARGTSSVLQTDTTNAAASSSNTINGLLSNGFTVGTGVSVNNSGSTYASWTFRKAAKFFDIVTYTGNGGTQNIAHNLGSEPGFVIIKATSTSGNWVCYHRSLGTGNAVFLNLTNASTAASDISAVSSTTFSVSGSQPRSNESGQTYVAYLFAHDAGGFGDSGNDSVVKCGTFTCDGSGNVGTVDLGWEPQWILTKRTNSTQNWIQWDNMRGWALTTSSTLSPNLSDAEVAMGGTSYLYPTATGFAGSGNFYGPSAQVIYIAIRRGPMKTPTDATEVFGLVTAVNANNLVWGVYNEINQRRSAYADLVIAGIREGNAKNMQVADRLRGFVESGYLGSESSTTPTLSTSLTNAEQTSGNLIYRRNDIAGIPTGIWLTFASGLTSICYAFRRAPGFFDVVCYTGTGSARTVSHNLGVAPELMIIKSRSNARDWPVYTAPTGNSSVGTLQQAVQFLGQGDFNNTTPTSSVFSVSTAFSVNESGATYVAYLFASCPGISKVGSYTGTGTTLSIDCGFTNGARFVLIKRTNSTGDWYIWDTARGIVSGDDPYLLLNSTAAEVTNTDYIDPLNSGFQISSTAPAAINASGGTYIFLAIA